MISFRKVVWCIAFRTIVWSSIFFSVSYKSASSLPEHVFSQFSQIKNKIMARTLTVFKNTTLNLSLKANNTCFSSRPPPKIADSISSTILHRITNKYSNNNIMFGRSRTLLLSPAFRSARALSTRGFAGKTTTRRTTPFSSTSGMTTLRNNAALWRQTQIM